jgi:DNA processing protein
VVSPTPPGFIDAEKEAWVVLLAVPGLGPVTFGRLLAAFGSARAVLAAASSQNGAARLCEAVADRGEAHVETPDPASSPPAAFGLDLAGRIRAFVESGRSPLASVKRLGLGVVTLDDPDYPDRLRRVDMPPPLLFVRGSLVPLSAPAAVAVVGTRTPTDRGRMVAGWIGSALARTGAVVVSGLAVGIDGAAHAAVVAEGRPTVAVLGGGHAQLFPKAHERLAAAIVDAGGTVLAELPPDTPATRGTFPRRNRVVSGLSDATVVVEAGRRSGALITAGWALEQGRECYLVPGPLDAPASEGCNLFLRNFPGEARIVCGIPELLEDLELADSEARTGVSMAASAPSSTQPGAGPEAVLVTLAPAERVVATRLCEGPATTDDLAADCGLSGAAVLSALTLLELRGLVVGSFGRYLPAGALTRWTERSRRR